MRAAKRKHLYYEERDARYGPFRAAHRRHPVHRFPLLYSRPSSSHNRLFGESWRHFDPCLFDCPQAFIYDPFCSFSQSQDSSFPSAFADSKPIDILPCIDPNPLLPQYTQSLILHPELNARGDTLDCNISKIGDVSDHISKPNAEECLTNEEAALYYDFAKSLKRDPISIVIRTQTSAVRCRIEWEPPNLEKSVKFTYSLEVWEGLQCNTFRLGAHIHSQVVRTVPGGWYEVKLACLDSKGDILAKGWTEMKAVFSRDEMHQLYDKALKFVGSSVHPFHFLYRCKPKAYFDDIEFNRAGIMEKYLKDNNGQAASAINGAISGLFFSARLLPSGSLPNHSPFGNVRMLVPAPFLLDPVRINMYFCDFYCNYVTHYVTVVICEKGSETDRFCQQHLIQLELDANPLLKIITRPQTIEPVYFVNKSVWVEIYYTENVPLSWGRFDYIMATGAGSSRIGGLPHNKRCCICNLYPQRNCKLRQEEDNEKNSTLELLKFLEEEQNRLEGVADGRVVDSDDIVETICRLVDSVVDRIIDDAVTGEQKEGVGANLFEQSSEPSADVIGWIERQLHVDGMKKLASFLKSTVESLEEKWRIVESAMAEVNNEASKLFGT